MVTDTHSTTRLTWLSDRRGALAVGLGEEVDDSRPTHIGPYRLLEKMGEGGLGIVWRAEQSEPIQRQVAVKLIKPGLRYRAEVITRFEMERQALARMNHPNIAGILDAGTLSDGRPYFVMELVRGKHLTAWSRAAMPGLRERLEVFITICQAVHHAHQKGILHRDLKPSNILITLQDGKPVPKIIDFGIAKALDRSDSSLNDPFFQTQIGEMPCATYPYMSPEQASRGTQDIDTRSDVYTLGVILYELLTGELPMPVTLARSNNFEAIAAHVREQEATRPSARMLSATGDRRGSDSLRGELDWIVLRALEKDRERRYDSAAALADDIQRHLDDEPVIARPPELSYRFGKWMRRHRLAFAAGLAVLLSLTAGLVSTSLALRREKAALAGEAEQRRVADDSRDLAVKRENEAIAAREQETRAKESALQAQKAAEEARGAAETSRQVADTARAKAEQLINDMLFDLRDDLEPIGRVSLLEQVSRSAESYFQSVPPSQDSDAQERNRAVMHQNRGNILLAKGDHEAALKSFLESLSLMIARANAQPANVQRLHDLALAHERAGTALEAKGSVDEATRHYEEMLRVFDHLQKQSTDKGQSWRRDQAIAHERLGTVALNRGQIDEARQQYEKGHRVLVSSGAGGEKHQRQLATLEEKLGAVSESAGDLEQTARHYANQLTMLRQLNIANPDDARLQAAEAVAHGRVAGVFVRMGKDIPAAADHAAKQTRTFQKLTEMEPLNREWQSQRIKAHFLEGVVQDAMGKLQNAISSLQMALHLCGEALSGKEDDADLRKQSVAIHLRLAAACFKSNQTATAKEHARQVIKEMDELKATPEISEWRKTAEAILE